MIVKRHEQHFIWIDYPVFFCCFFASLSPLYRATYFTLTGEVMCANNGM